MLLLHGVERPPLDIVSGVCWEAAASGLGPLCSFAVVLGEEVETTSCRHAQGHTEAGAGCGPGALGPEPSCFPTGAGYSGRLHPSLGLRTVETRCQPGFSVNAVL